MELKELPGLGVVLMIFEAKPGALQGELAQAETRRCIEEKNPVGHIPLGGPYTFYLPMRLLGSSLNYQFEDKMCKVIYRKSTDENMHE